MSPEDLEILYGYREKVRNVTLLIKQAQSNPNAPVDATCGMENSLRRYREDQREAIIDALVRHAIEVEERHARKLDDGR